jgi:outer membrane receptor for ferrienterochelin and colicins
VFVGCEMKRFIFSVLFFWIPTYSAQSIHVFSSKDSIRVSFAYLLITNDFINYNKSGSDAGVINLEHTFNDSTLYQITVQGFGFDKFNKKITGAQIKQLRNIYLDPSNINLEEVIVTAQYEPVTIEKSVQKVSVIDKDKIQQMGAVNLKDVLTNQLNVRLQQDNVLGAGMSLQGLSGQNVKILVDGVPVIGRLDGNIDLSQINMNNVERIEFIEGPLSVQYGTNALAGTINIITKKTLTKKITLGATSYYESIGTYNFSGDMSYLLKKHSLQINGGRNFFDGWSPYEKSFQLSKRSLADSTRSIPWNPKEQYFVGLAYQYGLKKMALGFKSAYFNEVILNRGMPLPVYQEEAFDDYYYTKRLDNSLSISGKLTKHWSLNAVSSYNFYKRIKKTMFKDLTTLNEILSPNTSDHDTSIYTLTMARGSFIYKKPLSKISYELGYDLNYESAFGKRIEGRKKHMGDYALFATMEYKIFTLVIKPGVRYGYNTNYNTPVVPSLNVKWSITNHHILRASYARGFRAPSLKELQFDFNDVNHQINGNENLKAEQSNNYSIAYNYNRDIRKCKLKFDVSFFYNSVYNLISLQQIENTVAYSYFNRARFKSLGIQLGNSLNFKRLFIQGGFNYTGRYNGLAVGVNSPEFSFSPEFLMNASYKWLKPKIVIALFYKYNGKVPSYISIDGGTVITGLTDDYHIMDATISKLVWGSRMNLTVGCKNMFDVQNIKSVNGVGGAHSVSSSSVPLSTGRTYFIKLAFNFIKA